MGESKDMIWSTINRFMGREAQPARPVPTASYLRDTPSHVIAARPAVLREHRDEIRMAWHRSAALAMDIIHNSGRLKGAVDQVLADTVGIELSLNPQPDLSGLGYDDKEADELIRLIKRRWKQWAWNPRECDLRGKLTVPQMVDIGLRWNIAFGEVTGVLSYMNRGMRRHYGITTGTKVCMVTPMRLVQDTSEFERLFHGVIHDENGRPLRYRFRQRENGFERNADVAAFDADGRAQVIHLFDPQDAGDVRGISLLAPAFRKHIQHEMLDDATLQTAILQTIFAATLTSAAPSEQAFEGIEALKDMGQTAASTGLLENFLGYYENALERAQKSGIHVSGSPQVSHLAPGEQFELHSAETPGGQYLPFAASLSRDMARAIGITYGGLTMDHTDATYSSVRMENASIWPVVLRRRERIAAPHCQAIYENWLDDEIGEGRLPFKGGYDAYRANRVRVLGPVAGSGPAHGRRSEKRQGRERADSKRHNEPRHRIREQRRRQ
jgi:lambda family phage portal protein